MQEDQTIQLFRSLPKEMQEAVRMYIQFLAEKVSLGKKPEPVQQTSQPTIRWAARPDATALQGLTSHAPLLLSDIRQKAWKR